MREPALARGTRHPREQARDAVSPVYTTRFADLLQTLDHCGIVRPVVAHAEAIPRLIHAPTGLGEQPARNRRLPGGMRLARRDVERPACRLRRRGRHSGAAAWTVVRVVVL